METFDKLITKTSYDLNKKLWEIKNGLNNLNEEKKKFLETNEKKINELNRDKKNIEEDVKNTALELIRKKLNKSVEKKITSEKIFNHFKEHPFNCFNFYSKILDVFNIQEVLSKTEKEEMDAIIELQTEINTALNLTEAIIDHCFDNNFITNDLHDFLYEEICARLYYLGVITEKKDKEAKKTPLIPQLKFLDKYKVRCFEQLQKIDKIYVKNHKQNPPNYKNLKNSIWS